MSNERHTDREGRTIGGNYRCPVCADWVFIGDQYVLAPKNQGEKVVLGHRDAEGRLCGGSGELPVVVTP